MKKSFLLGITIVVLIVFTLTAYAQIPNSGFEEWSGNEPAGWVTGNAEGFVFVKPSSNPMSGLFAARLETKSVQNVFMPAILAAGVNGEGFPVNQRHGQLSFYYKFSKTLSTAYLVISVGFKKGENGIGAGVLAISTPTDNYTLVTIPVTYVTDDIPDLATIIIQVTDQNLSPAASGSYAEIDNLSFDILSSIDNKTETVKDFSLEQNYPNPFNPSTVINYQIPNTGFVSLKVYDIIGNEVATLVNKQQTAGNYSVQFNASGLPSGVYLYRLQAGSRVETRKMTLLK